MGTKFVRIEIMKERQRILTGDRPTGKLHIGHYMGSLRNRAKLQDEYEEYIEIANIQALTDNFDNPGKVRENIEELLCDYYASGIDFDKATIFIQSEVPEIHELFIYLANFATVQQIQHNPTIKTEMAQKGMEVSTPLGFFIYPIHQAADILCVNADLVPVGKDQAPMIEDTRVLARKFNSTYKTDILHQPQALFGVEANVPGIDGNAKMGKSLNNGIYLSDSEEELRKKIFKVYTDPSRIHATDPGKIEGNVAFTYLDLFAKDLNEVEAMKERYRNGEIKDVEVKERLFEIMNEFLTPIRKRRLEAETMKPELMNEALEGSRKVSGIARNIADQMKEAMKLKF
jgi:tryptophanyl-tRNA synthetase